MLAVRSYDTGLGGLVVLVPFDPAPLLLVFFPQARNLHFPIFFYLTREHVNP